MNSKPEEKKPAIGAGQKHRDVHTGDPDFDEVTCPDCGRSDLEVVSLFGGAASEVLFRCEACESCFNWIKWRGALPPTASTPE